MTSSERDREIRDDWCKLGFFYSQDDAGKTRLFRGDRAGLAKLVELIGAYVSDPSNVPKSEHEHYGPYQSLKIMTWDAAGMDEHAIFGTLQDLQRLSELIRRSVAEMVPGGAATIRTDYAAEAGYSITLRLEADGFNPASADPELEQVR